LREVNNPSENPQGKKVNIEKIRMEKSVELEKKRDKLIYELG
jgi:hypothetical protein